MSMTAVEEAAWTIILEKVGAMISFFFSSTGLLLYALYMHKIDDCSTDAKLVYNSTR